MTVPESMSGLFPFGGLQRGTSVGFSGIGGTSVALAMAGAAIGSDGWMAVVGIEELGLMAASELGVRLDRLLMIESTGAAKLAAVVAALVEAADVILLNPRKPMTHREARRLSARVRERRGVLFHLDGGQNWPQALDVSITADSMGWEGLGQGHGHLGQRRLAITATGRRSAARHRQVSVLLPGPDGRVAPDPDHDPGHDHGHNQHPGRHGEYDPLYAEVS